VVVGGDLRELHPSQRVRYYQDVCDSVGLNWRTRPFEYLVLNGRLTLYATRNATDQLRRIYGVSLKIVDRKTQDGVLIVHCSAKTPDGREDEDFGVLELGPKLTGDARANAIMKCVTKSKRRVTLSICGLSFLDETEVETIPNNRRAAAPTASAEIARAVEQPVLDQPPA
jgi:hypothetical protein